MSAVTKRGNLGGTAAKTAAAAAAAAPWMLSTIITPTDSSSSLYALQALQNKLAEEKKRKEEEKLLESASTILRATTTRLSSLRESKLFPRLSNDYRGSSRESAEEKRERTSSSARSTVLDSEWADDENDDDDKDEDDYFGLMIRKSRVAEERNAAILKEKSNNRNLAVKNNVAATFGTKHDITLAASAAAAKNNNSPTITKQQRQQTDAQESTKILPSPPTATAATAIGLQELLLKATALQSSSTVKKSAEPVKSAEPSTVWLELPPWMQHGVWKVGLIQCVKPNLHSLRYLLQNSPTIAEKKKHSPYDYVDERMVDELRLLEKELECLLLIPSHFVKIYPNGVHCLGYTIEERLSLVLLRWENLYRSAAAADKNGETFTNHIPKKIVLELGLSRLTDVEAGDREYRSLLLEHGDFRTERHQPRPLRGPFRVIPFDSQIQDDNKFYELAEQAAIHGRPDHFSILLEIQHENRYENPLTTITTSKNLAKLSVTSIRSFDPKTHEQPSPPVDHETAGEPENATLSAHLITSTANDTAELKPRHNKHTKPFVPQKAFHTHDVDEFWKRISAAKRKRTNPSSLGVSGGGGRISKRKLLELIRLTNYVTNSKQDRMKQSFGCV